MHVERTGRPPKILRQITLEVLPRSADTTVDLAPAPPLVGEGGGGPGRPSAALRILSGIVFLLVVLGALALYGPQVLKSVRTGLSGLAGRRAARQPGRVWSPRAAPAAKAMVPRFSVPLPSEPAGLSVAATAAPGDLVAQLDDALTGAQGRGAAGLKPLVGKAALALIDPRVKVSAAELASLGRDEQRVLSLYQNMFSRLGRNLGQTGDREADLEYLKMEYGRLLEGLEDQKQLQITKLVLCRSVSGYGRYEAFYDNRFRMGALPLILVYTELANSKPQQRSDGRHVVRLTEELSLWDAANEKEVWHSDPVSVTDESSSRRRDFFLAQYLRLPGAIRPGRYNLRVRITDNADGSKAEANIALAITGR